MRSYAGAAHYNQRIAWIADEFFQSLRGPRRAARHGLPRGSDEFDTPISMATTPGPNNPVQRRPGRMVDRRQTSSVTVSAARQLYQQRLRYIVVRYGYSHGHLGLGTSGMNEARENARR